MPFSLIRPGLKHLSCFLLFAFVCVTCPIAEAQKGTDSLRKYQEGELYLAGSRVYIHVGKTGFGHEHAVEGRLKSGVLHLSGATPSELNFDMTSFVADTPAARKYLGLAGTTDAGTQKKVNANMLGKDVLNVQRFPTATLKVTKIFAQPQQSERGFPQYKIEGNFTLHGVTKPVSFVADVENKKGWLHLRGAFSILQSHYGIEPYSTALGTIGVADQLTIWGDLWVAERTLSIETK